jgi:hypothetical protein
MQINLEVCLDVALDSSSDQLTGKMDWVGARRKNSEVLRCKVLVGKIRDLGKSGVAGRKLDEPAVATRRTTLKAREGSSPGMLSLDVEKLSSLTVPVLVLEGPSNTGHA